MKCGQVNVVDTACSVSENRAQVAHTARTVPGAGSTFESKDGQLKMGYCIPEKNISYNFLKY